MWLRFKAVKNASEGLFDTWKNSTIKKTTNNFVAFDYPITNKNHWALFFLEGFSDVDIQHGIANNKGLTIVNHIYIYTHIHTHTYIYIYIYICMYVYIYIYIGAIHHTHVIIIFVGFQASPSLVALSCP